MTPVVMFVEDGLDVLLPVLELRGLLGDVELAVLEVGDHLVEGVDERSQLVRRRVLHADVQVAPRHVPGGLGEFLDGDGDPLGEMESAPAGGEDDEQGDEHQDENVKGLDRDLLGGEKPVSLDVGVDRADPLGVALGEKPARGHQDVADAAEVEPDAAPDHLPRRPWARCC